MKPIGGYFELELKKGNACFHQTPYTFKSGRSSLYAILSTTKPSCVYIPFYICGVVFESFAMAGVPYKFYSLDENLEPAHLPVLEQDEYVLYVDYFGVKTACVEHLSERLGPRLLVDCTLSFFTVGNGKSWFFNSCRKFFGVPDGSFLYTPDGIETMVLQTPNEQYTCNHLVKRFNGHVREGYVSFLENEVLCGGQAVAMSRLSEHLLSLIDYSEVAEKRRSNFLHLDSLLAGYNQLSLSLPDRAVPMYYPFLPDRPIDKTLLFRENIFIPTFWKDVLERDSAGYDFEKMLTRNLLLLPVDHRYDCDDMNRMVEILKQLL